MRYYALGALIFAAFATTACILSGGAFFSSFEGFIILPLILGIVISGNAHQPSAFGIYLGLFLQWLLVGLAVAAALWLIARRKKDVAS